MSMTHGIYAGPIEDLRGEAALLDQRGGMLMAQFDRRSAVMPEGHEFIKPGTRLGFGWHQFNKNDWRT